MSKNTNCSSNFNITFLRQKVKLNTLTIKTQIHHTHMHTCWYAMKQLHNTAPSILHCLINWQALDYFTDRHRLHGGRSPRGQRERKSRPMLIS